MDADETVNRAASVADDQKNAGASRLDHMARAVHGAADELSGQMPQAADLVHAAAARLEKGAGALRDRNMREIVDDLTAFGRRDPLTLFGGALVAGFALSRVLKSAADQPPSAPH